MSDEPIEDESVGYKRPPKSGQFKKGKSGNPGGLRKKSGPIKVDFIGIFHGVWPVRIAEGKTRSMSAKEIEIRQFLKKAVEKKDFKSIAHLLDLFERHGCVAQTNNRTSGVLTLPTNKMPWRMALLIAERYGFPEDWTQQQIAWGRRQFEATMTEQERQCEVAGIIP